MKAADVETRFRAILKEKAGDDVEPEPRLAWEAFLEFAKLSITCGSQSFLFECGRSQYGDNTYDVHFVRVYWLGGAYDTWAERADCRFSYAIPPDSEIDGITKMVEVSYVLQKGVARLKSDPQLIDTVDRFAAEVGDLSELWRVLSPHKPKATVWIEH